MSSILQGRQIGNFHGVCPVNSSMAYSKNSCPRYIKDGLYPPTQKKLVLLATFYLFVCYNQEREREEKLVKKALIDYRSPPCLYLCMFEQGGGLVGMKHYPFNLVI